MNLKFSTITLNDDITKLIEKGLGVPTAPGQFVLSQTTKRQLRANIRYINRNRRKIVIGCIGYVAAGILTGGVAPAIYAANKAASYYSKRVYRAWQQWRNNKIIKIK